MPVSLSDKVMNGPYDAINTLILRKALISDVTASKSLINDMTSTIRKTMEKSVESHLGNKIDVRV